MFLSQTYDGSVHDKRICDEQPLHLPHGITLWQDTGFIGHCPDGVMIRMPKKKSKGKELTSEQKQENREISKFRVLVEHAICGARRCHKFGFYNLLMELACGLHNFRITLKNNEL